MAYLRASLGYVVLLYQSTPHEISLFSHKTTLKHDKYIIHIRKKIYKQVKHKLNTRNMSLK